MPADFLYSASPPMFTNFLCNNFERLVLAAARSPIVSPQLPRKVFASNNISMYNQNGNQQPLRSCLVLKNKITASMELNEMVENAINTLNKKRVVFADDKGLSLTKVKIMKEDSNCPPSWNDSFLHQILQSGNMEASPVDDSQKKVDEEWKLEFCQPASDYVTFRTRLQEQCVCLENVFVVDKENKLKATIKVRNVSFEKKVYIRVTYNNWVSSEDIEASFVPGGSPSSAQFHNVHDTFSVEIPLISSTCPTPLDSKRKIEFCVCFESDCTKYWDNNEGSNYSVVNVVSSPVQPKPNQWNTSSPNIRVFGPAIDISTNDLPYW